MIKPLNKAVTTRFTNEDFLRLQQEAESRGCAVADVIRKSWNHFQQQQHLHQLLLKQERRQNKAMFTMLCAAIGLKSDERKQVLEQLKVAGVSW